MKKIKTFGTDIPSRRQRATRGCDPDPHKPRSATRGWLAWRGLIGFSPVDALGSDILMDQLVFVKILSFTPKLTSK